jgi:L,D-transpeptidase ErfK/SrfK
LNSKSNRLACGLFAASFVFTMPLAAADLEKQIAGAPAGTMKPAVSAPASDEEVKRCHWWQFGRCKEVDIQIDGLPTEAPRTGTVITVDVSKNTAYLFQDGELVTKSPAATGTGKILKRGSKIWAFHTPRGRLKVLRKIEDPIWRKPDWAFVEAGEAVPAPNSPKRYVKGHLGKFALDLGDGILIHGTDDVDSLGRKASHGCVRLPDEMLARVYDAAAVGTEVYIFESTPPSTKTANSGGAPEHHSDLD